MSAGAGQDLAAAAAAARRRALRVALLYALAGSGWILCSDWMLAQLVHDPQQLSQLGALKGWLFVALTAGLLYVLVLRDPRGSAAVPALRAQAPASLLPFAAAAVVIASLTGMVLVRNYEERRTEQVRQIETVAERQTAQLAAWFSYRKSQARFVRSSPVYASHYQRWRNGDADALAQLLQRLSVMRSAFGNQAVMMYDEHGELVTTEKDRPPSSHPALHAVVQQALASGDILQLATVDAHSGTPWLDMVVPLVGQGTPAQLAVVLRVDLNDLLQPMLGGWPSDTRSGRSVLLRRDGDMLTSVLDGKTLPLATPQLLAGRALLGGLPFGHGAAGTDVRGLPVFGAVRPLDGGEWLLVAQVDQSELRSHSLGNAEWIVATGAMALLGAGVALVLLRERRALNAAQVEREEQAKRLRALALVQAIAEGSNDAIFAKDLQGRYLLCNREASRVLGRRPDEVLGTLDTDHMAAGQAAQVRSNDAQVVAEGRVRTFEEELTTGHGLYTFLSTKGPLRDDQGQVIGMFGISRDITERKRAELALREANALVQSVTDSVLDHMAVLDRDGVIVKVNAAWARFAQDNGGSAVPGGGGIGPGTNYLAVCRAARGAYADEAADIAAGIEAVLQGRQPSFSREYACHSPQQRRWFLMTVTPLNTEAGGAVVVHSDITARHEAQEQLRKLSLAVEQSPMGIAIRDTSGRIEYVNDAFAHITGFSREEAVGRPGHLLQPRRVPALRKKLLWQTLQRGETWSGEFRCQRRSGEHYDELVRAAPIRQADGLITHHLWIVEDVTEKKRTAAELDRHRHRLQELVEERTQQLQLANAELVRARDQADAANAAKSAFLANMSHEIRTPLNAILGLTHLLRRDVMDALQAERLARIGDAANHLLQVINDILDLSKIEAGRLELEEIGFSLRALLEGSRALVSEGARAKGLLLTVDAADVPDALQGDPTRLSQALLNLLSNAVKFTERGQIAVRAQVLERDAPQGLLLRMSVRDTGKGIEPDKLEQLFGAFVQEDASTTRRFGGTGLGLAITQRLAAMMGGQAGVSSEPGTGSEFWFTVRVREGQPDALAADTPVHEQEADADTVRWRCGGARVLLAEDDPISQGLSLELLHWAGLDVDLADDGREAVQAAETGDYDLILMDMQMPHMNGLEAARRIRELPRHRATPILAMTAAAFTEDRAACLEAGMNDHVPKPVDPPRLFAALLRWLPVTHAQAEREAAAAPAPDAAGTADEIVPTLPAIAGLDAALALRYLGGQAPLYRRVLEQFLHHYGTLLPAARRDLAAGDMAGLRTLAHVLWGSAEPIGAAALARRARALDRAVAEGASAPTLARAGQALLEELEHLLGAIAQALELGRPAPMAAAAPAAAQDAGAAPLPRPLLSSLRQLAEWLRQGDYRAVALWRELGPALRRCRATVAADMDTRLLAFDFEGALEVLLTLPADGEPARGDEPPASGPRATPACALSTNA